MTNVFLAAVVLCLLFSCKQGLNDNNDTENESRLEYGGDLSLIKKLEDLGGQYKIKGEASDGLQIFRDNGYTWCRLRLFHSPNHVGPVVNDLEYTIALAREAKAAGFKLFLNFHYSDTWADPGKQYIPRAWENLGLEILADSVYSYTLHVMEAMREAGVFPQMVQVGNEINNGMLWPHGRLWDDNGKARWDELALLLKAGVRAVKDSENGENVAVMIHAATGGNLVESDNFYSNLLEQDIAFDVIGLSYYPWWHGTFEDLEKNLQFLSGKYDQEISVVETAYYANGWYPEPEEWVLDVQPYPPTEQGQYDFLVDLATRLKKYPKVTSVYYWEPEGLDIPGSDIHYLGRSLFSRDGNAFKGIAAWKE